MIRIRTSRVGVPLLLGAVIAGGAIAQPAAIRVDDARAGAPAAISNQGEMTYLNGGIGKDQADMMRAMSPQFPVRMTFSRFDGSEGTNQFVADVRLRVTDQAGHAVVDLTSQGPIFLLRLPDGAYTVEAEHEGVVKTQRLYIVAGEHRDLAFSWS